MTNMLSQLVLMVFVALAVRPSVAFQPSFSIWHLSTVKRLRKNVLWSTLEDSTVSKATVDSPSDSSFRNFDFKAHWYPVVWKSDLPLNKPTRVTLFDVDYVVARTDEVTVMAMVDKCPHKLAALSEGRITSNGYFQCAYHGWSFSGKDGSCVEIPQVVSEIDKPESSGVLSARTCGTAVPAMIKNEMTWLFPGGNLEQALLAPPPPSIAEFDDPNFRVTTVVRDFPVDYSILLESILDPDHGLFAHGFAGFDLYSASKELPQSVQEEFPNGGKGWKITSRVKAVNKLIQLNKLRKGDKVKSMDLETAKIGTSTFTAPSHVVTGRRDSQGKTMFLTAFWVTPTGTGRSRFMSAAIAKAPFSLPRWFMHINLNNFLDQDTHLLATQARHVLKAEAASVTALQSRGVKDWEYQSTNVRKKNYNYRSPTERLGVCLGAFWDATLSRAPNRIEWLLKMDQSTHWMRFLFGGMFLTERHNIWTFARIHRGSSEIPNASSKVLAWLLWGRSQSRYGQI
jgi:phenylpropionate dioxygenase-like ring-hydroxylating dioxygenase large terminal subunit